MINEIVKMVANKANLSEPIARIAVDVVISQLRGKLPPVVGNTLDSLLGTSTNTTTSTGTAKKTTTTAKKTTTTTKKSDNPLGDLGNIAGTLGNLLGKK